jgi:membrane protein
MRAVLACLWEAYNRFLEDDGWAIASHIALSTLTSMFPFLIFLTALAGFFGSKDLADQAVNLLLESWPRRVADPLGVEIHSVLTQANSGLLTVGAVLALWFSSSGIEALRVGLNRAYDTGETRPWWLLRLESIAYVLIGAVALLALTFLVVLAPVVWEVLADHVPQVAPLWQFIFVVRYGVTALVLTLALVIAHKWLPAGQRSFARILPGVALTLVLSLAFAVAFGTYLAQFARNYVSTYAGLASVMIALVFLYALASIFVFGGELNAAIARRMEKGEIR